MKRKISLITDGTADLHPAVLKRVILQAAEAAGSGGDLDEAKINAVRALLSHGEEGKETDLLHGNYVRLSYGRLWFLKRTGKEQTEAAFPAEELEEKGSAAIEFCGRTILLKLRTIRESGGFQKTVRNTGKKEAESRRTESGERHEKTELCLDWDLLKKCDALVFRFRRPGDKIRLRGMAGRKKAAGLLCRSQNSPSSSGSGASCWPTEIIFCPQAVKCRRNAVKSLTASALFLLNIDICCGKIR